MAKKVRPSFMTNISYGKTKIMDKDIYFSDNESKSVIVEDILTRNKAHKEKCLKKVKVWREHHERTLPYTGKPGEKFPQMMIERYEMASKLTLAEFKNFCATENEERWRLDEEYRKEHPMEKEKIEKLQEAFDELNKNPPNYSVSSTISFHVTLDPLRYIGQQAYDRGVYDGLLDSFQKQAFKKWSSEEVLQLHKENRWWPYGWREKGDK
jgi:hypothetical protein